MCPWPPVFPPRLFPLSPPHPDPLLPIKPDLRMERGGHQRILRPAAGADLRVKPADRSAGLLVRGFRARR